MSKQNEDFVKQITKQNEDFSQWYTDVIRKADLVDYAPVKGFMVIKPYGYALWENMQRELDKMLKASGHKNAYFPLFIPENLLQKEAEHVEGFAPEVAWVTIGGTEELAERIAVRPTSEAIICSMYSKWIKSYRDLPILYNQWCNVVRWEKSTRPFLRTSEFLWQEGHTAHATEEDAQEETLKILGIYKDFAEKVLAIPMLTGEKSEKEKFAGAKMTYSMEAMMLDGKALQAGTSHNLGQHFAKVFDIQYLDRDGELKYVWSTSWGVSTRLIGGIIMVHGDDRGLVLPPRVAPYQVVIVPIAQHKEGVLEKAGEIFKNLSERYRVELDDRNTYSVGWKFNEWELKGVPLRLEIGPRDIQNNQVVAVRRDTGEKTIISMGELEKEIGTLLEEIQRGIFQKALEYRDKSIRVANNMEEFASLIESQRGFIKAMWCEASECEATIKEKTGATTRCIPFEQDKTGDRCVVCGKPAERVAYFAKAY
ncbi:MAG: proline--tRNA ligase [Bacillota bacterium]|nr:proline--tRNA ligase [Bacillota bacterium]MDD3297300.1 proline--tRNA ligase [Bacillota bacterium]MDD3850801.1 proline--tRNA ligase [Bacillota bacterium]MDD4706816.1 proline--tRNA ligase [Bacillota bacterium]